MWCIGKLTEEYHRRMHHVLDVYAQPYREREPVICIDEKSKQLIRDSRASLPMKAGAPAKLDYEYVREGIRRRSATSLCGWRREAQFTRTGRTKSTTSGFAMSSAITALTPTREPSARTNTC